MIAEVIPYTRTQRGKEVFDYTIPSSLNGDTNIQRGSIVTLSFRSKQIPALVWKIKQDSTVPKEKLKPIVECLDGSIWLDSYALNFLQWFSEYYYISLPHAFKTLYSPLIKKLRKLTLPTVESSDKHALLNTEKRIPVSVANQLIRMSQGMKMGEEYLVHYSQSIDRLLLYRELIAKQKSHVLIIVPEYYDVREIASFLTGSKKNTHDIIPLYSDPSPTLLVHLHHRLQNTNDAPVVIIGTKKCAFMDPSHFSVLIMDQEEARSHKQYHLNPRYHVRDILEYTHRALKQHSPAILFTSNAPSIEAFYRTQTSTAHYIPLTRKWNAKHITLVSMEEEKQKQNFTWFSDELIQRIEQSKKTLLFFNRTGNYSVAVCTDCSQLLPLTTLNCTFCGGTRITHSRKGTARLEQELHTLFPKKTILRIDRDQETTQFTPEAIEHADIIIATEKIFRITPLQIFDCIGILSIDHLLIYPHFRAHERVFQLLIQLCSANIPIVLQTHSPNHPIIQAAVRGEYTAFVQQEMHTRKSFNLPPFKEYFHLINGKTKKITPHHGKLTRSELSIDTLVDRL